MSERRNTEMEAYGNVAAVLVAIAVVGVLMAALGLIVWANVQVWGAILG